MSDSEDARRVFVTGASGFVGRAVCESLAGAGYDVFGLVRSLPEESLELPGVSYVTGDVSDAATITADKFAGCDWVVHLVGIIAEVRSRDQTFDTVHVRGTANVVRAARQAEVSKGFIYVSALGASSSAKSDYSRTKAAAERIIQDSDLPFTIFRPSLILGRDAGFVQQIEGLIRKPPLSPIPLPFIPLPGKGANRFQPLFVGDLTQCIVQSLKDKTTQGRTFEIGGADEVTFETLVRSFAERIGSKKTLLHIPMPAMFAAASLLEALLPKPPITVDQLINLRIDNVCNNGAVRDTFGISPLSFIETLDRIYSGDPTKHG